MGRRRIIRSPITKQSIRVLRMQSRAFLGAQTAGSFDQALTNALNERHEIGRKQICPILSGRFAILEHFFH
jgi:hypothetical protein